jgi:hypothetical protein
MNTSLLVTFIFLAEMALILYLKTYITMINFPLERIDEQCLKTHLVHLLHGAESFLKI